MKKAVVVSVLVLGLIGKAQARLFDWVPSPKDVLNGVADTFGDVWDGVQDFVIDPLVNLGSDGVEYLSEKVVGALGLSPDLSAKMKELVDANVKLPYDVRVVQADASDASSGLFVITDPYAHKVFFKDDVHLESINIPGAGNKNIPAMGFFAEDGHGHALGDPRGLTTDGDRNFWIADATLGCVWNLYYDPVAKALKYAGSMTGFEAPFGVAYSRGHQAGSGDDVVYVTNSGSNSICRVPRTLGVDQPLRTAAGYFCTDNFGGGVLVNPRAIVTEDNNDIGAAGSPTVLYVTYDGNKIARIQDLGNSFSITATTSVETASTVKFTGLATDLSGNLYAVDNLGGRVFYFSASPGMIEQVFAFGQSGSGSTAQSVKFNKPKGISISGTDIYVVEEWSANSGLQKFKAVPTIDRNNTHIEVSLGFPGNMDVNAKVASKGRVSIELALYDNLATMANPQVVWVKSATDLPVFHGGQGYAAFPMVGNTGTYTGITLPDNRLYRMTVKSYVVTDLVNPIDVFINDFVLALPGQVQPYSVQMKDNATPSENISKPEIRISNLSTTAMEDFTVRFWFNREEFPSQLLEADKYYTNPDGISKTIGYHPANPNVAFVDFKYPAGYLLNPGSTTLDQGFQWGIHFKNYWPGVWDKSNDYSWQGITSAYSVTRNVSIFDGSNSILYGSWPTVIAPPVPSQSLPSTFPVFGFENVSDWSSSQAILSLNAAKHTEGASSLSVSSGGWAAVRSAGFSTTTVSNETSRLAVDMLVPVPQTNPWWAGSVNFFASCPAAGINNVYLGHYEFTTLPQDQFNTLYFDLPANVLTALQGDFSGFYFQFEFSLNPGGQPVLLDNMRFVGAATGTKTVSGKVTGPAGGLAGVSLSVTGTLSANAVTDAAGNYVIGGLPAGGSYSVMPSKTGYTFTPAGKSFSNLQTNMLADFTATIPTVWQAGTLYAIGILVTYQGIEYQCIQGHTSQVGWEPPFVPASWQKTGTPAPSTLPSPWSARDVGSVGYAGTATYASSAFTVNGSGADIWGTADAFNFVFQPIYGDVEIKAKVNSVQNTDNWAKAGVMLRESLAPGSPQALMAVSAASGIAFQRRAAYGSISTSSGTSGAAPKWVRLTRIGAIVTAYWSVNGLSWNEVGSQIMPMATPLYAGLAVTAHNNSALCEAAFSNVSLILLGANAWTQTDIGSVGVSGNSTVSTTSGSVSGSGADIWGTADAFTYVHQAMTGDGSLVARVSSVQNTSTWAKAGVMIRENLAANSRHAQMVVSAASGVSFQYRLTPGGNSFSTTVSGAAPTWIRIDRIGNLLTGFKSADGVNWTQVGSVTMSMGSTIYLGLAVTSHNNPVLSTASFDNLSATK